MAWCAWLWVGHPSCCRRVSAGDQPTSVSLPVWRGHFLKCSQSSGAVWSHGQHGVFFGDGDVLAGEPSGDPGEEWQLLPEELDASFLEVGWDVCWAQR